MEAYRDFRDVLAEQIRISFPELKDKVEEVIDSTGGRRKTSQLRAERTGGGQNGGTA